MSEVLSLVGLAKKLKKLPKPKGRPLMVAISGFGGSGKTFIAKVVQLLKPAYGIHLDDFLVKDKLLAASPYDQAFDRTRLKKQVLEPITHGQLAIYQKFLWHKEALSDFIEVPSVDFLLVEGISAYHSDIAKYFDVKVWIDVESDVATARGQARDEAKEGKALPIWKKWQKRDLEYFAKYQSKVLADFVIDNS